MSEASQNADQPSDTRWSGWWRAIRRGEFTSWTGSLLVHVVLLGILATVTLSLPRQPNIEHVVEFVDRPQDLLNARLDEAYSPAPAVGLSAQSHGSIGGDAPLEAGAPAKLETQSLEPDSAMTVSLAELNLRSVETERLTSELGMESPGDPSAAVEDYSGAVHRLTQELVLMLANGPVLLCWLFDQSESMQNDLKEIQQNIERIYDELGLVSEKGEAQLSTSVASYGEHWQLHTRRPTSDFAQIHNAIDEVPIDRTGKENLFSAIGDVVAGHRKFASAGKRQMALVVVSDESGDDAERVEAAIAAARDARCRVYVLGREAVFGYPYLHVIWKDDATGYDYWIPIRRGPEAPEVEQLQTDGLWARRDAFPSGFGPYEQARLCRETGGVFYLLPSLEANVLEGQKRLYALDAMRPYLPDMESRAQYHESIAADPLRRAVQEIIRILDPRQNAEANLTEYYPLAAEAFAPKAVEQQQRVEKYLAFLRQAEAELEKLHAARNQEPSPRWQANYDLLLAQVVGYQVRAYEYGAMLAQFLAQPKRPADPRTNFWRVNPVARLLTAAETGPTVERATRLFQNVSQFHAGTPHSARAQWELARGFGCEMVEHFHPPDYDQVKRPNL